MIKKTLLENPIKNLVLKWRLGSILNSLKRTDHIINNMSKDGCITYLKHSCGLNLKDPDVLNMIKIQLPEIFKKIMS